MSEVQRNYLQCKRTTAKTPSAMRQYATLGCRRSHPSHAETACLNDAFCSGVISRHTLLTSLPNSRVLSCTLCGYAVRTCCISAVNTIWLLPPPAVPSVAEAGVFAPTSPSGTCRGSTWRRSGCGASVWSVLAARLRGSVPHNVCSIPRMGSAFSSRMWRDERRRRSELGATGVRSLSFSCITPT